VIFFSSNHAQEEGRGKRNSGQSNINYNFQPSTIKEMKFHPFVPGNTTQATYASAKDAIVLRFRKDEASRCVSID
jgi:hypothetical protein